MLAFAEASVTPPDPSSVETMAAVDALPERMRALVHDYGITIVVAMWNEGFTDAGQLAPLLEERRRRAQKQWLDTDYILPKGPVVKRPPRPVVRTRDNGRKATFADMLSRYQDAEKAMMNWNAA